MSDYLLADIYAGDGDVEVEKTAAAGLPWIGYGLKVNQGDWYDGGSWFQAMWPRVMQAGGDRYGVDWFRLGYSYLDFAISPERNADGLLKTVDRAGGWSYGDLVAVDVERGGQRVALTKSLVEDTTSKTAEIIHNETGMPVIFYGGETPRSLGITDHMHCEAAWVAEYELKLNPAIYLNMGWGLSDVIFWQYAGKENAHKMDAKLAGYPWVTPAGLADISALIYQGGGDAGLSALRMRFCVT